MNKSIEGAGDCTGHWKATMWWCPKCSCYHTNGCPSVKESKNDKLDKIIEILERIERKVKS